MAVHATIPPNADLRAICEANGIEYAVNDAITTVWVVPNYGRDIDVSKKDQQAIDALMGYCARKKLPVECLTDLHDGVADDE